MDERSYEINAILAPDHLLATRGAIVTTGVQKSIAMTTTGKKSCRIFGPRANQGPLGNNVAALSTERMTSWRDEIAISKVSSPGREHVRMKNRNIFVIENLAWLPKRHRGRTGLSSYISALPVKAERLSRAICVHSSVGEGPRRMLDLNFCDENSRTGTRSPPVDLFAPGLASVNALREASVKKRPQSQRTMVAWSEN